MADVDLAIIGGGMHGTGIARDAAGRGLKVLLVEQNDLASGTSCAASKLTHGVLRYLEQGAFQLAREALRERKVLMRIAPHLVRPLRFVLLPEGGARAAWRLRLALFLYDHIGGWRVLPATRTLDLTAHVCGAPLKPHLTLGFEYSDCHVDEARLVVLNALDAAERGATIRTRTRCIRAERGREWTLVLNARGRRDLVIARALVNAAGPWVGSVAESVLQRENPPPTRRVKESRIVVKRLFHHDRGYVLAADDRRTVFALPFAGDFTLIGTTAVDFTGDPAAAALSEEEIASLCATANAYFRHSIVPSDVLWAFAGVRSLLDDRTPRPEDARRDHLLALDAENGKAPLLTIYGGKIATYRRVAEAAMGMLARFLAPAGDWTAREPLPGGDFADMGTLIARLRSKWPFLTAAHARRLAFAYGTRAAAILGKAKRFADLGPCFGTDLTGAEVLYLMRHEWAETADDVLWRRSQLGLRFSRREREALERFMADAVGADAGRVSF